MKKRGQITVFIILGIIILAVVGGFLAFRSGLIDTYLDFERNRVKVPNEIAPVQEYLELCLEDSVNTGTNLLGLQGGYLDLDTYEPSVVDKFTNVLTVYPGYKVAYWYYESLGEEGKNQMPSLNTMQRQLNEFVKRRFIECLDDLEGFEKEGFEIDVKDIINPDIEINDEYIDAVVRIPVNVKKSSVSAKISRHVVTVDSSFGRLYEQAKRIFEKENDELWLESKTLDYLYAYTEDLPHYDVEFTCKPLVWKESEISENYKRILELNIPYYMVEDSVFENYYVGEPFLTWDIGGDFSDAQVYFEYDRGWPFELDIQGSQGDAVVSQPFPGGIPMIGFCVNNYNLIYSIKYPVLISVKDSESDEEFSFATQVVVRNNQARRKVEPEPVQYCGIKDIDVDIEVFYADETGFYDSLESASVFYKCMNHVCYLGDTDETGKYIGKAPICLGGELEVIKDGYKANIASFDTFGDANPVSVYVEKLIPIDYEVMVYDKVGGALTGPRSLSSGESVVFEVRDSTNNIYSHIGFYPNEETSIDLAPGNYYLIAKLLNEGPAHIQQKEISRCKCPEIFSGCLCGEESITLEAFDIEDVMTGGAELEFVVERGSLDRDKVVFYVVNGGLPDSYDDLGITYDSAGISSGFTNSLRPSFENE